MTMCRPEAGEMTACAGELIYLVQNDLLRGEIRADAARIPTR
jgi:hypothetical protein